MTTNASRQPVDRYAFDPPVDEALGQRPAAKADPLAELARIVGQDDPFRALLEAQGTGRPAARTSQRVEPAFEAPQPEAARLRGSLDHDETPADAFDRYLAEVGHDADAEPVEAEPPHAVAAEAPRARRRLMSVGAGIGICVVAVAGAMTWKGMHGPRGADGQPIMVMADKAPLKVAPQDAGGVEIPDQNKQIYDRTAKDGQVRIVNREEQPLDVSQVARAAAPPQATASTATAGAMPQPINPLTETLGEPRRVRTVSVRPETPPFARDAQQRAEAQRAAEAQRGADAQPVAGPPTMVLPQAVSGAPQPPLRPSRPVQVASATATDSVPAAMPAPPVRARAVTVPRVAPAAVPTDGEAAEAPEATASAPVAAAAGGGFAVQLAVRPSEKEARAAFKQLQDRFGGDLAGRQPLIRQAEVNGKTIFRVRVGPLAREDANGLCSKLQGSGGQCFVAKN